MPEKEVKKMKTRVIWRLKFWHQQQNEVNEMAESDSVQVLSQGLGKRKKKKGSDLKREAKR